MFICAPALFRQCFFVILVSYVARGLTDTLGSEVSEVRGQKARDFGADIVINPSSKKADEESCNVVMLI